MDINSIIHSSDRKIPNRFMRRNLYIAAARQSGKSLLSRFYRSEKLTDEEFKYAIKLLKRYDNIVFTTA